MNSIVTNCLDCSPPIFSSTNYWCCLTTKCLCFFPLLEPVAELVTILHDPVVSWITFITLPGWIMCEICFIYLYLVCRPSLYFHHTLNGTNLMVVFYWLILILLKFRILRMEYIKYYFNIKKFQLRSLDHVLNWDKNIKILCFIALFFPKQNFL